MRRVFFPLTIIGVVVGGLGSFWVQAEWLFQVVSESAAGTILFLFPFTCWFVPLLAAIDGYWWPAFWTYLVLGPSVWGLLYIDEHERKESESPYS